LANSGSEQALKTKVGFVEPMLSLPVAKLPEGPAWSYELKFAGYRALGLKTNGRLQLLSRISSRARFLNTVAARSSSIHSVG
jgi:ATP-dependent DNA ligase